MPALKGHDARLLFSKTKRPAQLSPNNSKIILEEIEIAMYKEWCIQQRKMSIKW